MNELITQLQIHLEDLKMLQSEVRDDEVRFVLGLMQDRVEYALDIAGDLE